ncbi:hypothetical protein EW146_g5064 [Bondarzewia mesenterica]|uniref:Uncharacterized protein n=1 Tax=Bondarzewia mesenterica TaxID=1095465 RepID=A0A4S4LUR6_9AGAM|nr:hypothetical protein EW146_g5064 [Bondarzewia mesenterica]
MLIKAMARWQPSLAGRKRPRAALGMSAAHECTDHRGVAQGLWWTHHEWPLCDDSSHVGRDIEDGLRRRSPAALSSVLPGPYLDSVARRLQLTLSCFQVHSPRAHCNSYFVVPPISTQMSHDGSPTQSSISQTQGSSPSESTFLAGVARACESIVEEYRRSCISKAQASRQILATLSSNPDSGSSDAQPVSEDERGLAYGGLFRAA